MSFEIYTLNAKDYLLYPIMKQALGLSAGDIFNEISYGLGLLQKRLNAKGVDYQKLKGALIPNQERNKHEVCLVIDSSQIQSDLYGEFVFDKLFPLLDKKSTCSIMCGDYVDTIWEHVENSQFWLRRALYETIHKCNPTVFQHSEQYFLIYFNRISNEQQKDMVEALQNYPWFTGFADVTRESRFKSYLSHILVHSYVKCGMQIISPHPADYEDEENINMSGYPFEKYGYQLISINEDSFGPFLSYKIESIVPDEDDVSFSFNALFPKFDSISKLKLTIKDKKWDGYLTAFGKDRKGNLLYEIGYGPKDRDRFIRNIYKKICACYIYNLRKNVYEDLLFNVCVDLPTINGNYRRTTVGLKYLPETGEMEINTVT